MDSKLNIRSYRNEDMKVLLEMTSEEGWSFSEIDCRVSLKVDPEGLLVAEDETGMPIGFIRLFSMTSNMTYVNVFVVRKDLHGNGIGKKLWEAMLKVTKDNTLVLDGVSQMKGWYEKRGFSFEAHSARSFHGTFSFQESVTLRNSYNIVPLSDDIWSALIAYDKQIYPYSREHVLRAWFCGADRYTAVAFLDKSVVGYANIHWKSKKECNIRVLNADNDVIADTLLLNLLQHIPLGSKVSFILMEGKPIPKYLSNFKSSVTGHKLFTKEMTGIQTDKIIFHMCHTI
ncbi:uncharacterized protein LOC123535148 [Mercenaria mercenaria]|uniref:uncharacterized protein LOC123535148 n=1 Tax=Mercenaria mercenaria TaxID=6596 RepID=UPI00234F7791|nr:uncharacterized protein LOC123535148 [Mercenaria mercenaria]